MHYYKFNINDFINITRHLSRTERHFYLELQNMYIETERELTTDFKMLCRKLCAHSEEDITAIQQVLSEFYEETPGGWFRGRYNIEIEEYRTNSTKKSLAGIKSAEKRAQQNAERLELLNKETDANSDRRTSVHRETVAVEESDADVQLNKNQELKNKKKELINQELKINEHQEVQQNAIVEENDFEKFWSVYPKKFGKSDAEKAWGKIDASLFPLIMSAIQNHLNSDSWKADDGRFIPYPAKWLNSKRWNDVVQQTKSSQTEIVNIQFSKHGEATAKNARRWLQMENQLGGEEL